MKTELKVTEGNGTLTIYEGAALPQLHPNKLKIDGNIKAVSAYLKQRLVTHVDGLQKPTKELAVIIVDEQDLTISLKLDPNNPHGTEVTGKLQLNKDLTDIGIYVGQANYKKYSREELVRFVKLCRRFFPNKAENEKLLAALQTLSLNGTTSLNQSNDNRGNKGTSFVKTLDTENIPKFFFLELPIYNGFPAQKFNVEICLDSSESAVHFWLESVELIELLETTKADIFSEELKPYSDFAIIYK